MGRSIRAVCLAGVVASVALLPDAASGQHFGSNKVQYKSLQFQVLKTPHFDIYFHQDEREPVDIAGRLAERWWNRLSALFGTMPEGRQPPVLYSSHAAFEQTLVVPVLIDARTGGVTGPTRRRIAMPFASSLSETDHVLGHELVHAFQFDILASQHPDPRRRASSELPLWFIEGPAEFLSLGSVNPHTAMWMRDAVAQDDLPSLQNLRSSSYFPYRWGHAFWAYVSGRWGSRAVADLFTAAAAAGTPVALERVLDVDMDTFAADWHAALRAAYQSAEDRPPIGTIVIPSRPLAGSSNVGPALSPDGRWVTFVSERSLVSMDLFVADAATGAIVRKLTDTAGDPHYSNLQFIDSAGAWDRGGRRLAVGTMISGRAALTIFGWPGGARQLDVMIDEVDEIFSPTWSPDRRSIAFSGMVAGVTDLFVYDLPEQHVQRLTHDPWVPCRFTREEERHDTYVVDRGGGAWRRHGVHRQSGQSVRGAHRFGAVPKSPRLQARTRQHVHAARQLRVVHVLRSLRAATATATTFEIHPPLSRVVSKGADVPVACSKHLSVSWENPIRGASARTGPRSLARACSGRGSST